MSESEPSSLTGCSDSRILSVPDLVDAKRASPHADLFARSVGAIKTESNAALIDRTGTVGDPLLLWAVHQELDRRGVPPCLRIRRQEGAQEAFMTWLADVYWISRRKPGFKPPFTRWAGLFSNSHDAARWYGVARWVYSQAGHRGGNYGARGLGLSDADRQDLKMMPTYAMQADRKLLRRLPDHRDRLFVHALAHRDRSGVRTPEQIADRRAELLRLFLLAGRSQVRTIEYLKLITGETMSRQALAKQLDAIELGTGLRLRE